MDNKIKHYIRLNENKHIILGLSDAIPVHRKQILQSDICINENSGRHFGFLSEINPSLKDENGICNYKYENSQVLKRSEEEKQTELLLIQSEQSKNRIYNELNLLDKDLQRGTEDLIELFITKGIIEETDLPIKTIERLNRKKELRASLKEV